MNFEGLLEVSNTETFLAQQRHTLYETITIWVFKSFNLHSTWVEIETPEFRQVEKRKWPMYHTVFAYVLTNDIEECS